MTDQELAAQMKFAHGIAIDPASALAAAGLVASLNTTVRDAANAKLAFEVAVARGALSATRAGWVLAVVVALDLWSVGVCIYVAKSGRFPFQNQQDILAAASFF